MKTLIIFMMLFSSSLYAQETIKVIGLKNTDAEAVTNTLKSVVQTVDKDKERPSTEKMAEAMFKRIDVDKNGSLSLKEFKAFYAKIRSSRGPQGDRSGRGRPSRGRSDRDGPKKFGPDKKDGLRGPPRGEGKRDK